MASDKRVDVPAPRIIGPEGPYRCIYIDPPWPENGGGKSKRGADKHYPTMSVKEITVAVLGTLNVNYVDVDGEDCPHFVLEEVADDAHCWMWVTDNYLEAGLDLMRMMGFNYKRTLVWAKISPGNLDKFMFAQANKVMRHIDVSREMRRDIAASALRFINRRSGGLLRSGLGHYARGSHELLLFGTRGKTHWPPTDVVPKSVQFAPITKHSAKPELFYDIIEACSPGPRLEMFARNARPGWAVFGNEVSDG